MDHNGRTKLAVFDIDGTIFRKNLHFELINELSWTGAFPKEVRKRLTEVYADWLEHEGTYDQYRQALVDLYAEYIRGVSEEKVREASRVVIPFHMKRTYIFAEQLIRKFRQDGYHIIAVSGSPIEIVEEYNRDYLHFDFVFGSVYEKDDAGFYTGGAVFEPTRAKGDVVKTYASEHGLSLDDSYGIGDTESDVSLLEIVDHPIAFNPNRNLKEVAEERGWRIVVEKKDVIYEIAARRGESITGNVI
ncbi:MAG: HAD-IB family hydrolase [Candidatus Moranbacteria bacterium]|nr:HAD-IB family hydrolase [Candidatus Moranbacteria bacterium]NTW46132.1 HAD-IB family hydrolase [Candidatus Moranbacteria bacterium]